MAWASLTGFSLQVLVLLCLPEAGAAVLCWPEPGPESFHLTVLVDSPILVPLDAPLRF